MRGPLIVFVMLALIEAPSALPQKMAEAPLAQPKAQNFSGFVTEQTDTSLTVSRKGTGKETLHRVFVIDSATKVEGNLKLNARVTVRYVPSDGTDRAIHILVR